MLKMTHVHVFTYILIDPYPKIMKLISLETTLNKLSVKQKQSLKMEDEWESYGWNKLYHLYLSLGTQVSPCLVEPDSSPFFWPTSLKTVAADSRREKPQPTRHQVSRNHRKASFSIVKNSAFHLTFKHTTRIPEKSERKLKGLESLTKPFSNLSSEPSKVQLKARYFLSQGSLHHSGR